MKWSSVFLIRTALEAVPCLRIARRLLQAGYDGEFESAWISYIESSQMIRVPRDPVLRKKREVPNELSRRESSGLTSALSRNSKDSRESRFIGTPWSWVSKKEFSPENDFGGGFYFLTAKYD